jgi:hypothetical protein
MPTATGTSLASVLGTATVVSIGSITGGTGTETFVPIDEISDAKFSGRKRATTTTTNFQSLNKARKLGTILDCGTLSLTFNRVPNDPGQLALSAANVEGSAYDFTVQLPVNAKVGQTTKGDLITLSGIVTECSGFDVSLSKQAEITATIEIDGDYSFTAGS